MRRLGLVIGLIVVYTIVLLGRGLPFWLGAALYVVASILLLQAPQRAAEGRGVSLRDVAFAVAVGLASGWIITSCSRTRSWSACPRERPVFGGLSDYGHAFLGFMNPTSIALGLGGALLGIIVGILPGLSATLVIALLTTITIKLPPSNAILVLICSYVGALYGGSRTAILLNIPGTAANAASCADGYALAQRGEAGRAIGIATSGAFTGTLFGVLCLAAFTPSLAEVALAFGAFEFFWLALFGVAM